MADMPTEEFRRAGHKVTDWIADYLRDIRDLPVLPRVQPGVLRNSLPASSAPKQASPWMRSSEISATSSFLRTPIGTTRASTLISLFGIGTGDPGRSLDSGSEHKSHGVEVLTRGFGARACHT